MKRRRQPSRRRRISNPLLQKTLPNFSSRRKIHHTGRRVFVEIGEDPFTTRKGLSRTSSTSCVRRLRMRRATLHAVMKKTSNAIQKEEVLVAVVAKHTFKHHAVAAMFVILDGEISTSQQLKGHSSPRPKPTSSMFISWCRCDSAG